MSSGDFKKCLNQALETLEMMGKTDASFGKNPEDSCWHDQDAAEKKMVLDEITIYKEIIECIEAR